jgi:V/A-type H+/Na+-transporting ATPase subunit A
VVGEEGTSLDDFVVYLKGEFLDAAYLQQNSFDAVDASVSPDRQKAVFSRAVKVLGSSFDFKDKEAARSWFNKLRQMFLDMNGIEWDTDACKSADAGIIAFVDERVTGLDKTAARIIESLE